MHPPIALASSVLAAVLLASCAVAPPPADPPGQTPAATSSPVAESATPAPSVTAVAAVPVPPRPDNLEPVRYFQFDEPWATLRYGEQATDTIRRWGCGPVVMAMVVATLRDPSVDPAVAAGWSGKRGYFTHKYLSGKTTDAFFTDFAARYGIRMLAVNKGNLLEAPADEAEFAHLQALQAVKDGNWVVALMAKGPWTTEAHYVLWYDAPGDEVLIKDPNSKKAAKARNKHSVFVETVMRYWIVDVDVSGPVA